jgi:SAM-dependent methyltransferase
MDTGRQGLSLAEWHARYRQQGIWSSSIQDYLFNQAHVGFHDKILEVGSGTGAIAEILSEKGYQYLTGVDINHSSLFFAQQSQFFCHLTQADGYQLPFKAHTFKVSYCHYLLLWIDQPDQMLTEMRRVTEPGGYVMALAEPDHQARIDYPPPLDHLGELQTLSLHGQGVDVQMGRKLRSLFQAVGLRDVQSGILGAQWSSEGTRDSTEWVMIKADLGNKLDEDSLAKYKQIDLQARNTGTRVLFVPTFFALGKVPE